jgi:hypothetical protein
MHRLGPADELAEIRAEIARLKLREAALRAGFLADPGKGMIGRWNRVEVVQTTARIFDHRLLPAAIRDDPRYSRDRVTQSVRCLAVQIRTPRPGWPIRMETSNPVH